MVDETVLQRYSSDRESFLAEADSRTRKIGSVPNRHGPTW